ncbi:hypothetical protein [Methanohalophilus sp.]|uniref:hypothetical protein n=1 Tax=Methanohalophilus sp. TaxID=1966352 RepID=UPI002616BB86|nr:hypothetical protein [Methanohalophilus sp.]
MVEDFYRAQKIESSYSFKKETTNNSTILVAEDKADAKKLLTIALRSLKKQQISPFIMYYKRATKELTSENSKMLKNIPLS